MSWELMNTTKRVCPCGNGTCTYSSYMDDWNRSDSSLNIDCPDCAAQYGVFKRGYYDSGRYETTEIVVKQEAILLHDELRKKAASFHFQAKNLRIERYLDKWHAIFAGRNRRSAWALLTDNGNFYPALGTFYKHTKNIDLQPYLDREFSSDDEKMSIRFLRILSVEDNQIEELYTLASKIELDAKEVISQNAFNWTNATKD